MSKSLRRAVTVILTTLSLMICGLVYSYILATKDFEPAMQANYYETGLDYQKVIDANEQGKNFLLSSALIDKRIVEKRRHQFKLAAKEGFKISSANLEIIFERRASIKGRKVIQATAAEKTENLYSFSAELPPLPAGSWEAMIKVTINDNARIIKRWRVDKGPV